MQDRNREAVFCVVGEVFRERGDVGRAEVRKFAANPDLGFSGGDAWRLVKVRLLNAHEFLITGAEGEPDSVHDRRLACVIFANQSRETGL